MPDLSKGEAWEQDFRKEVRSRFPGFTISKTKGMVHLKYKKDNGKIETRLTSWPWNKNESSRHYPMEILKSIYSIVQRNSEISLKESLEIAQKNYMHDHIEENLGALDPNLEELIDKSESLQYNMEDEQLELLNKRDLEIEKKGCWEDMFDVWSRPHRPHIILLEVLIREYFNDKVRSDYSKDNKHIYYVKITIVPRHKFELDCIDIELGIDEDRRYIKSMSRRELYKDLNIDFPDLDEVSEPKNQEDIQKTEDNNDLSINEEEVIF